ncbi:hypothetical protein BDZ91DRAFT_700023 [Kalaharituber pfeilii]|nr:hypothetical protein BDZ91DRAFT_700023 [Kalaharituber pfeilii]
MAEPQTPKLPSSFPTSPLPPRSNLRSRTTASPPKAPQPPRRSTGTPPSGQPAVPAQAAPPEELEPRIATNVVDAPTQRFYAFLIFGVIQAIKISDIAKLYTGDDNDSISELYFCFKWLAIDGLFFWFLPYLRIPWLTFSPSTTFMQILFFFAVNMTISFKYTLPFSSVFYSIWKTIYDRELSLSERSVKIHDITHNSSHIQGKYTVHILPEGAAMLNPFTNCFCLEETSSSSAVVPIRINGTEPLTIQLERADFETGEIQVIDIKEKETKKLLKQSRRDEDPNLRYLQYIVKSPGLYRLRRVMDIAHLDVRITQAEALVVTCPKASIKVSDPKKRDRCSGDLSDLSVVIEGLAPLDIKYSRIVKDTPVMFAVSRIYTENYQSPLLSGWNKNEPLMREGLTDFSWGKRQKISIPLNESLASAGDWVYAIDTVKDACGNVVHYSRITEDGDKMIPKTENLAHTFTVHGRPQASFLRCDPLNPMSLPPGRETNLQFNLDFRKGDGPYTLQYTYSPHETADPGVQAIEAVTKDVKIKTPTTAITIGEPGLYTLKSISNKYCQGDILEPSTCLVITPPKPSVSITHENILDKCSSSAVGITIDVTLVGTPDFKLWYRLIRDGATTEVKKFDIDRTRYQATITPSTAGHYVYEFYRLDDKWNEGLVLDHTKLRVEQTIQPMAGATFAESVSTPRKACIEEPVEFKVNLQGIPPWKLKYDLIHSNKRKSFLAENITEPVYTIRTQNLNQGGKYALALVTVEDNSRCKVFLDAEAKIDVRFEKPRAAFGPVDGKMSTRALEGKEVIIPLRMRGEKPWTLRVQNRDFPDEPPIVQTIEESNSHLKVKKAGRYELLDVKDVASCPGIVTDTAKTFEVTWIDRPTIRLSESAVQKKERENLYFRREVCEGDEDAVELAFTGSAPYQVTYWPSVKTEGSTTFTRNKQQEVRAGLSITTVRLDTSSPGMHRYEFLSIADSLYDDPKEARLPKPLVLQQRVNPKPSAKFADPTKIYKYCRDAGAGDEYIPIQLTGTPPFQLQINIKHHSTGKNENVNIPAIDSNLYRFQVPPHALTLGSHTLSLMKVRDARGCVRKMTPQDSVPVHVAVADLPTITPDEAKSDYCVGDRISYSLQGSPPFAVEYLFENVARKASSGAKFSRVAPGPGNFTITGLLDSASDCKVHLQLTKIIHEIPSVKISEGTKGIHEGDQAEIHFQFFGTPPFTFTYTRSEIPRKGGKPRIIEQYSQTTDEFTYSMFASQEGTYEVTSIEDKYCSYSKGKK